MTAQFIAYNNAFGATTALMLGTSYAAGAKCALQLQTPSTTQVKICEWFVSFSGSAAGTPSFVELVQNGTGSTMSTAHTSSTVLAIGDNTKTSVLTYGATTNTGYGNGAITSATPDKYFDAQQVAQTGAYGKIWLPGREPVCAVSKFLQLRVNTAATLTMIGYIVFEEC